MDVGAVHAPEREPGAGERPRAGEDSRRARRQGTLLGILVAEGSGRTLRVWDPPDAEPPAA